MQSGRDLWYHDAAAQAPADCPPEPMNAEDPLFILYTSGSTGKPKGVLHTSGGYLVWAAMTHDYLFDYRPDDVYWRSDEHTSELQSLMRISYPISLLIKQNRT